MAHTVTLNWVSENDFLGSENHFWAVYAIFGMLRCFFKGFVCIFWSW